MRAKVNAIQGKVNCLELHCFCAITFTCQVGANKVLLKDKRNILCFVDQESVRFQPIHFPSIQMETNQPLISEFPKAFPSNELDDGGA